MARNIALGEPTIAACEAEPFVPDYLIIRTSGKSFGLFCKGGKAKPGSLHKM